MELPVWHFVGIGSGLIIGIVSVLHVFVAQFAVGGGIYLVWKSTFHFRATRSKSFVSPDSSRLLVDVPCAMSFFTVCLP